MAQNEFAVSIIVVGPGNQTVLVRDEMKPLPHFWKFPGGKSEPGETPPEAAVRELREETGVDVENDDVVLLVEEPRRNHIMYLFAARVEGFGRLKPKGDEGEDVLKFSLDDVLSMVDFFPPHRDLLQKGLTALKAAA